MEAIKLALFGQKHNRDKLRSDNASRELARALHPARTQLPIEIRRGDGWASLSINGTNQVTRGPGSIELVKKEVQSLLSRPDAESVRVHIHGGAGRDR